MPKLYIIAGCNGAGKTTASYTVLPEMLGCREFVNADEIAKGLSPFNPESVAIEAGRLMLQRMDDLLSEGEDFAFETTLATKTGAQTAEGFWRDLETSLRTLKTDYIDIYQFHNPAFCPKPGGEDGLYDAALEAKKQGKIRHISITNHRLAVAQEAIDSGLYASLQFPFSYLAGEQELALVEGCRAHGMGFIAMKGMAGGLLRDGLTAAAWMAVQENVVPIWGVQRESELDQFLQCIREGTELTDERRATIERDRRELCGEFCRGCGYCMPCPAGIEINQCARMSLMLRRAPAQAWLTEEWQARMHQIEQCRHCGHCIAKCPYGLNTPELLQANYKDYWEVLAQSRK